MRTCPRCKWNWPDHSRFYGKRWACCRACLAEDQRKYHEAKHYRSRRNNRHAPIRASYTVRMMAFVYECIGTDGTPDPSPLRTNWAGAA